MKHQHYQKMIIQILAPTKGNRRNSCDNSDPLDIWDYGCTINFDCEILRRTKSISILHEFEFGVSCLSKYLSGSRGKSTLGLSSTTSWMLRRCHQAILEQTVGWSQDYRLRGWHWSVWSWASQTRLHSSVCSGHLTWNVEWSKEEKRLPEIHLRSIELWSESWSYHWRIRRYDLHWNAGCCACQTNCSGGNDSHDQDW